jgi:hypothetical protein
MKSEDIPIIALTTQNLAISKTKKSEIKIKFLKKNIELSFNNEDERDNWFEIMQLSMSMNEDKINKIVIFNLFLIYF